MYNSLANITTCILIFLYGVTIVNLFIIMIINEVNNTPINIPTYFKPFHTFFINLYIKFNTTFGYVSIKHNIVKLKDININDLKRSSWSLKISILYFSVFSLITTALNLVLFPVIFSLVCVYVVTVLKILWEDLDHEN